MCVNPRVHSCACAGAYLGCPNLSRLEEFEGSLASYHYLQFTAMKPAEQPELGCILKLATNAGWYQIELPYRGNSSAITIVSQPHNFCCRFDRDSKVAPYEVWNC